MLGDIGDWQVLSWERVGSQCKSACDLRGQVPDSQWVLSEFQGA